MGLGVEFLPLVNDEASRAVIKRVWQLGNLTRRLWEVQRSPFARVGKAGMPVQALFWDGGSKRFRIQFCSGSCSEILSKPRAQALGL